MTILILTILNLMIFCDFDDDFDVDDNFDFDDFDDKFEFDDVFDFVFF